MANKQIKQLYLCSLIFRSSLTCCQAAARHCRDLRKSKLLLKIGKNEQFCHKK